MSCPLNDERSNLIKETSTSTTTSDACHVIIEPNNVVSNIDVWVCLDETKLPPNLTRNIKNLKQVSILKFICRVSVLGMS